MLVGVLIGLSDGSLLERQVLEYIVRVYNMTESGFEEVLELAKPQRREELMGTVAEEWMERGKAEGKAEGKSEGLAEGEARGKAEGKAEAVLSVLESRFGGVDARVREQVWAADADALDAMLKRAGTVQHPDEVFGNTSRH